jgi:ParB family chromosome partitioning protein
VREAVSDEEASRIVSMKKQAMAEEAERLLMGRGWLPDLLRSSDGEHEEEERSEAAA